MIALPAAWGSFGMDGRFAEASRHGRLAGAAQPCRTTALHAGVGKGSGEESGAEPSSAAPVTFQEWHGPRMRPPSGGNTLSCVWNAL